MFSVPRDHQWSAQQAQGGRFTGSPTTMNQQHLPAMYNRTAHRMSPQRPEKAVTSVPTTVPPYFPANKMMVCNYA